MLHTEELHRPTLERTSWDKEELSVNDRKVEEPE